MGLCQQYASLWPADQQDTAQAVCLGESGGNASIWSYTGCCLGLWQINCRAHPDFDCSRGTDPAYNSQYARQLWASQGWSPWEAYTSGSYRQFLTGAPVSSGSGTFAAIGIDASGGSSAPIAPAPAFSADAVMGLVVLLGIGLAVEALL